jgi:putative ABC transport system substrate-binding protein
MTAINRRDLIGGFAALGSAAIIRPATVLAQQPKKLRVGTANILPKEKSGTLPGFEERMAQLGYQQGENFDLEFVLVPSVGQYEATYREIAARKVNIILALGPEIALKSALAVAGPLPIVIIAIDYDPLSRGYVPSLARPSGNITGVFFQQIELTMKRLQLMQEALPETRAVTVLWDQISADQWRAADSAAATLAMRVSGIEMHAQPYDYDRAFAQADHAQRGGLMVLASPVFGIPDRKRLPDFALRRRLPSMFVTRDYVAAGGLMSYGPSFSAMGRRAAEYVDRIARGAKPADLPIEQPTKFELVVNLKTAKALGITIPQSILLRADEVIE